MVFLRAGQAPAFLERATQQGAHGAAADVEHLRYLSIAQTLGPQSHAFQFTWGQASERLPRQLTLLVEALRIGAAVQDAAFGIQSHFPGGRTGPLPREVAVAGDPVQPGREIAELLPGAEHPEVAQEALLEKILGQRGFPGEQAGVAEQTWSVGAIRLHELPLDLQAVPIPG